MGTSAAKSGRNGEEFYSAWIVIILVKAAPAVPKK